MEVGAAIVVAEGVATEVHIEEVAAEVLMKVVEDVVEATHHIIMTHDTPAAVQADTTPVVTEWRTPIKKHIDL